MMGMENIQPIVMNKIVNVPLRQKTGMLAESLDLILAFPRSSAAKS